MTTAEPLSTGLMTMFWFVCSSLSACLSLFVLLSFLGGEKGFLLLKCSSFARIMASKFKGLGGLNLLVLFLRVVLKGLPSTDVLVSEFPMSSSSCFWKYDVCRNLLCR